jgi:hypothetical protein
MRIELNFSALQTTPWTDYAVRFLFGGAIAVLTGLIAKRYGAAVGGLFLAFPAILPASATLVEKHEGRKKLRAGIKGSTRGRQAAALDARGAASGSVGLICFAVSVWKLLPSWNAAVILIIGTMIWLGASVLIWRIRKSAPFRAHRGRV